MQVVAIGGRSKLTSVSPLLMHLSPTILAHRLGVRSHAFLTCLVKLQLRPVKLKPDQPSSVDVKHKSIQESCCTNNKHRFILLLCALVGSDCSEDYRFFLFAPRGGGHALIREGELAFSCFVCLNPVTSRLVCLSACTRNEPHCARHLSQHVLDLVY